MVKENYFMEIQNQNSISGAGVENKETFTTEVEMFNPLEIENETLRQELAAERDARRRLAAEYDNYRRRTKGELERASDEGKRELLVRLLSIADDLELTLPHLGETTDDVAEGIKLVSRRFNEMLRANSVVAFKSEGKIFDPRRHEAFDVAHGTELKAGTVHSEIRRGYLWDEKLLRPALVVVSG